MHDLLAAKRSCYAAGRALTGVSCITDAIHNLVYPFERVPEPGRLEMPVNSAVLVQDISSIRLRNAFSGSLAALVVLLILLS